MAKGKVESVKFVGSWKDNVKHNFAVKFEEMAKDERVIFAWKDKENPLLKVGDVCEYNLLGRNTDIYIENKKYTYPAVELPKATSGGFGGGGSKLTPKTPAQVKNDLIGFIGGYAKDIIAHRVNLGKTSQEIVVEYKILVDGMFEALSKHVQ